MTAASVNSRAARIARGECEQCGEPAGGRRLCDLHLADHRERNRRYERALRKRGVKTPRPMLAAARRERWWRDECKLVAWAIEHERVPTLPEVAALLGHDHPLGSYCQARRRAAFQLRPIKSGRAVIPFPVPARFRQDAA